MKRSTFSRGPAPRGGRVFRSSNYRNNRPKRQGQYIDPQRFVNTALAPQAETNVAPQHSFRDFNLLPTVQRTLEARGYLQPTPVQDGAIGPALAGRDVIGLANTGTGKTAAFVLPIIQRLHASQGGVKSLIVAPTRELAVQINDEFRAFSEGLPLQSALCVGGVDIKRQIHQLTRQPQVVVGTPGRLKDLYNQGYLRLGRIEILVLDEVDRMLDMGFIRDIRFLLDKLPRERQSLFFSATLPPEIKQLSDGMLKDPVTISVRTAETSDHVEQNVIQASSREEKHQSLEQLLRQPEFEKVLIFGQTKWGVQRLSEHLQKQGFRAEAIHGNKTQPQRQRVLQAFRKGQLGVLVATDVAARGLDIPMVTHVINFDQPTTYEDYIHRIGRTGRAGNRGQALTFV